MHIGIDLGGTKTEIICLDDANGKELYRQRVPSPKGDYAATVKNIAGLVETAEKTLQKKGTVGIGIPGTISPATGLVKNANSTWLNGHPLDKDVGQALGREVRVQNDANCFAVSEAVDGAGAGKAVVFGVIVGTGCGAGVAINGQALTGRSGLGGEWGHNPLPAPRAFVENQDVYFSHFGKAHEQVETTEIYRHKPPVDFFAKGWEDNELPGPACYCGRRGCIETWISGTGFKNDHIRVTGQQMSTHDIIKAAEAGEPEAVKSLHRYADRLARALGHIVNVIDPDVIVLGGGMSNVSQLYEIVPNIWEKYIFTDRCDTPIKPPRHGDSSGVRGAAWLWNDRFADLKPEAAPIPTRVAGQPG